MKSTILILFALRMGLYPDLTHSQTAEDTSNDTNILKQFVLVREPLFVENCVTKVTNDATLIFPPEGKKGDSYLILTHTGNLINGTVTEYLDGCEPFFEGMLALLSVDQPIRWTAQYDALLAIKPELVKHNRNGSVLPLADTALQSQCLAIARSTLPPEKVHSLDFARSIVLPNSIRQYVYLRIGQSDRTQMGDQSILPTGFLLSLDGGEPQLLMKEDFFSNVFAISDLDNDQNYELLVYSGGWGGGTYEVRLFDGTKFTGSKRELYTWED